MDLELWKKLSDEGFSLIPLRGKKPFENNWQQWCLKKRPFIANDFIDKNAGIACGPASGIIVVDEDDKEKFKLFREQNNYDLPETRVHETGSGKPHYVYRDPSNGHQYGNCSRKALGFDIRGFGGQVVAPGSIHPDTGRPYRVLNDCPIADCPQWVLDLARKEKKNKKSSKSGVIEIDVSNLPISDDVKSQIFDLKPRPTRSEGVWYVLCSLIEAGVSREIIHSIFERYSVGEKYREKGRNRTSWLDGEIDRALAHVKNSPVPVAILPNLSHDLHYYYWKDEDGDGLLFSEIFKDRFRFDRSENNWYQFMGHVWVRDKYNQVFREIDRIAEIYSQAERELFKKRLKAMEENEKDNYEDQQTALMKQILKLHKVKRRKDVLVAASSGMNSLGISGEEWDQDNWRVACKNGILDIRTGQIRAGRPEDYIRRQINTEWLGFDAKCPVFDKFMNDIFMSDIELIRFVLRLFGYALTGTAKEHIFVMLYGKGRNGKDTLMEIIHHVFGDLARPVQSELLFSSATARSSSSPSPDILDLRGR